LATDVSSLRFDNESQKEGTQMTRPSRVLVAAALVAAATTTTLSQAQNWPEFRGGRAGVAADHPALPDRWSETENVAWKIPVPGRSWSSPVVWGDHVFVTTAVNVKQPIEPLKPVPSYVGRSFGGTMSGADISQSVDEHRWMLYDIDLHTGAIRWERTVQASLPGQPVHQKNSYASETPVTDGERVYVYLGYAGLFAFDMTGTPVWSKPMKALGMRTGWGSAASPTLHDGRLYIVNDNEERSFLAAVDAATGRELWRVDRDEGSNWSTPFVWQNERGTEIVTTGSRKVRSYDTAGKLLWELRGMTSIHAATPIGGHGLLYVSSGYPSDPVRPVYAIRPGASGDISLKSGETNNAFVVWSHPTLASCYPSPLVVGNQYYTLMDRGFLTSNDPKTGKEVYGRQRVSTDSSAFSASPWSYNGKIFALSEDGDTFVIQAGPEFRVLGKNPLNEMTLATPAIAGGSLIIRTASKLYRISSK
jgi:outer membrane protein assembly factor BamB